MCTDAPRPRPSRSRGGLSLPLMLACCSAWAICLPWQASSAAAALVAAHPTDTVMTDHHAGDTPPDPGAHPSETHWLRQVRAERFEAPTSAWLERFSGALRDAQATGAASPETDATWHSLGLEVRRLDGVLWLRERMPAVGHGAFALRAAPTRTLLLQAPHGDTDLGTGRLALLLFEEAGLAGLALNSARRDLAADADLARGRDNPFVRMAVVLAERDVSMRTVQLHGFSAETARALQLDADAIVVGGDPTNDARAAAGTAAIAHCLREAGFTAHATDARTRRLAGRGNPVGRALHRAGKGDFVHLELGPAARTHLLARRDARERLLQCL